MQRVVSKVTEVYKPLDEEYSIGQRPARRETQRPARWSGRMIYGPIGSSGSVQSPCWWLSRWMLSDPSSAPSARHPSSSWKWCTRSAFPQPPPCTGRTVAESSGSASIRRLEHSNRPFPSVNHFVIIIRQFEFEFVILKCFYNSKTAYYS